MQNKVFHCYDQVLLLFICFSLYLPAHDTLKITGHPVIFRIAAVSLVERKKKYTVSEFVHSYLTCSPLRHFRANDREMCIDYLKDPY